MWFLWTIIATIPLASFRFKGLKVNLFKRRTVSNKLYIVHYFKLPFILVIHDSPHKWMLPTSCIAAKVVLYQLQRLPQYPVKPLIALCYAWRDNHSPKWPEYTTLFISSMREKANWRTTFRKSMCKAEILVSQGRGKDKIDFDQTCSPSFFFDLSAEHGMASRSHPQRQ